MKGLFSIIKESAVAKMTGKFTVDYSDKIVVYVSWPKNIEWPESYEEVERTRWSEGGDLLKDFNGELIKLCPECELYYVLDNNIRQKLNCRLIFQWSSNNKSWGTITGPATSFKVDKHFKKCELVAVPVNCSAEEFVIGEYSPKYPMVCTYDIKNRVYASNIRRGGKFVEVDTDWNVKESSERKQGVANDVFLTFGKWYGYKISEVCEKDPEYAVFLMRTSSVGYKSYNDNLLSCQSYIDKNLDWKPIQEKIEKRIEKRKQEAIPKGTVIEFEGTCKYCEKNPYERVASWLPKADQERMNFDCILITCDNGLKLKVLKRQKSLRGKIKGTAVVDWYGAVTDTYGVTDVKILEYLD